MASCVDHDMLGGEGQYISGSEFVDLDFTVDQSGAQSKVALRADESSVNHLDAFIRKNAWRPADVTASVPHKDKSTIGAPTSGPQPQKVSISNCCCGWY